jgi:hypothetical protein
MNRNLIIGIVAAVVVVGGAAAYIVTSGDDGSQNNSASTGQSSSTQEQASSSGEKEFNPENTMQKSFVSTLSTEGEGVTMSANIKYDGNGTWQYETTTDGQDMQMIITPDAYYTYADGQWIKLPSSGDSTTGFDPQAYEVTPEELSRFQSAMTYKGEASCPAGTCDLWEADRFEGSDKISFYIDPATNTINQLTTEVGGSTTTITYTFQDVTIEIPTDVRELPSLN